MDYKTLKLFTYRCSCDVHSLGNGKGYEIMLANTKVYHNVLADVILRGSQEERQTLVNHLENENFAATMSDKVTVS